MFLSVFFFLLSHSICVFLLLLLPLLPLHCPPSLLILSPFFSSILFLNFQLSILSIPVFPLLSATPSILLLNQLPSLSISCHLSLLILFLPGYKPRGKLPLPYWAHYSGNELSAAVHEGTGGQDARTSGEQQLLLRQHQYWPGGLRVVCSAQPVLGSLPPALCKVSLYLQSFRLNYP